jgi:hypothetical protein
MADTTAPVESRPSGLGRLLLALVLIVAYWVIVMPLGLLLRLVGVDLMRRRVRRDRVASYRVRRNRTDEDREWKTTN